MTLEVYNNLIRNIFNYFQRSMPNREQLDLWYDVVKFIPDVAVEWIYRGLTSEDQLPRNLPKAIQAGWFAYYRANPNKRAHIQEPCDDCMGRGWMIPR